MTKKSLRSCNFFCESTIYEDAAQTWYTARECDKRGVVLHKPLGEPMNEARLLSKIHCRVADSHLPAPALVLDIHFRLEPSDEPRPDFTCT